MDPISIISGLFTVVGVVRKIATFFMRLKDAPKIFQILVSEIRAMAAALDIFEYRECDELVRWIFYHRKKQWRDLVMIIHNCKFTLLDMMAFVDDVSKYCGEELIRKSSNRHYSTLCKRLTKPIRNGSILGCIKISLSDIQPLRDQTAVPTRALNIFLVSMTFVTIKYNQRLSGHPELFSSSEPLASFLQNHSKVPEDLPAEWAVVGKRIAFKKPSFSESSLARPGVEKAILACAERIVRGEIPDTARPTEDSHRSQPTNQLVPYEPKQLVPYKPSQLTTDPIRGRSYVAIVRNADGTLETVRRKPSRVKSQTRMLTIEAPATNRRRPWSLSRATRGSSEFF